MVLLAIVAAIVAVILIKWYFKQQRIIRQLEKIPGPPPWPIIGNAIELASTETILPAFLQYHEKYGGIVKLFIGPIPNQLLISDYDFLEYLLSSTKILEKSEEYKFLSNWLGTGLLLANGGPKWKLHRKILTPSFHLKILEEFIGVFESTSKILVEKLKKEVGKPSFNIYPYFTLCTLDIICETAMGTSVNAQINSKSEYVESVKTMCETIMKRTFNPILQYTIPYVFTPIYWKERQAVKFIRNYTKSVIDMRKKELKARPDRVIVNSDIGEKNRLAFLDLLLMERDKGEMLTDEDIREEVDTFMFAGHDTTSSALSFLLFCISKYPEVQSRLIEELQEIFADNKTRPITLGDLQEMKYAEAVIKETLRLYPPVPFFARKVQEETQYKDITLPKDTTLIINAYGIHQNANLFDDPGKFDPGRFITENAAGRLPYGYIPFSAGPRNCIGQRYAMLEIKAVLLTILRHYEVLPATPKHNLRLTAETVLTSANGICISLQKRSF